MTPLSGTLESIQVGQPQTHHATSAGHHRSIEWNSAIDKRPISEPMRVSETGLAGDAQADRKYHGGIDKALLAYSAAHYDRWRDDLPDIDWRAGGFGENLTVSGMDETDVCIADLFRIGDILVEVSQPRQPCWKPGQFWNQPDLAKRIVQTGRCGWYLRVRETGTITAGQRVELVDRPQPEWPIGRATRLMYGNTEDQAAVEALAKLPPLSLSWREDLIARRLV